ncbi:unnamed protein product [Nesidiocoris tenuis]|uniref:PurM-like N-terminal domain-containing protein n=1 Tax=Nesidiocoris tenuis TaxID=355587 RepID=A0A6H5H0T6_9HEMI|nr:unnamed protein product [Nesidiocoris tenuis]
MAPEARTGTPVTNASRDAFAAVQLEIGGAGAPTVAALALRRPFEPSSHGLDPSFRLTRFSDLKGRGCKVPQEVLGRLLDGLTADEAASADHDPLFHVAIPRHGKCEHWIGMDAAITPLRAAGLSLVQTTDFIYPLVDDPYMMGKIACANVLSDLYALGVTDCDNMLMLLAVSTKMTERERDVVTPMIMRGFKDSAMEAGTMVSGGQTVVNPWCTIGGVATTVAQPTEYIM